MVQAHAMAASISAVRPTDDVDVIVRVGTSRPNALTALTQGLRELGYSPSESLNRNESHTVTCRGQEINDLGIVDHLGSNVPRLRGRPVLQVEGGRRLRSGWFHYGSPEAIRHQRRGPVGRVGSDRRRLPERRSAGCDGHPTRHPVSAPLAWVATAGPTTSSERSASKTRRPTWSLTSRCGRPPPRGARTPPLTADIHSPGESARFDHQLRRGVPEVDPPAGQTCWRSVAAGAGVNRGPMQPIPIAETSSSGPNFR
jgi:hypothetical protein